MRLLVARDDEMVVAVPDGSSYVYGMTPEFVYLNHRLDGSQLVISTVQFQTLIHRATVARREKT